MKTHTQKTLEEEILLNFFAYSHDTKGKVLLHSETDREKFEYMKSFITSKLAQAEKIGMEKGIGLAEENIKRNIGILGKSPSDPLHISLKTYIKCCKWWEDTIYKSFRDLSELKKEE